MKKILLILMALALLACLIVLGLRPDEPDAGPAAAAPPAAIPSATPSTTSSEKAHPSFLYGRVTAVSGAAYEGRLRWGVDGGQEAFWGDYFNGFKKENPWAAHVPPERLPRERRPIEILGIEIFQREGPMDLGRNFMARFGDISRIEGGLYDVRVTLKSGTVFNLHRNSASDLDDGVRVWDTRGIVDLDSRLIKTIELLPSAPPGAAPSRLHGTVRTRQGSFTGFVQWDREECLGSDELDGRTADGGRLGLRFDTIRSIARHSDDSSLVTLLDGREVVLSGTYESGDGNRGRGVYVDDRRYGRVLVSWDAFERLDFSPAAGNSSGPAYGDFPPGGPLTGSVTTRDGRRLAGRLVYDLDESETTETLDAPSQGVSYTLPFGLVASIVLPGEEGSGQEGSGEELVTVTLHNGEELQLERTGDFGERNAGMLIFADGAQRPEYVPWTDIERIELDRPPAMYPPSS
jgi:hypothetical protein